METSVPLDTCSQPPVSSKPAMASRSEAGGGQREDLASHRPVHRARVALLEIGAAAAADQQAIAGEGHAAVVEHIGETAVGMAWGGAHQEPPAAEPDDIVLPQIAVGPLGAARRRQHDLAAGPDQG